MPQYILIDTANWKKLVSKIEVEKNLSILLYLSTSGQVKFLLPVSLKDEWEKHKKIEMDNLERSVTNQLRSMKLLNSSDDKELLRKEAALRLLETQIELIDEIFSQSIPVPESGKAINLIHAHQRTAKDQERSKRLPPFQNKQDSYNDAITIFTTLDYLDQNGIADLFFLSENHTDFGSPLNPENEIHPGIASTYPSVTIHYFSKIPNFLSALEHAGLKLQEHTRVLGKRVRNDIVLDRLQPLVVQLYEYIEKRFREFYVLPKHLYTEHYPFCKGQTIIRHAPFTLYTDNEDLYELLEKPFDHAGLPEDLEEKRQAIILHLWNNQLYQVSKEFVTNAVSLKPGNTDKAECTCLLCLYKRFDFAAIIEKLDNPEIPEKAENIARLAFIQYVMGKHLDAVKSLKALEAKGEISQQMKYLVKSNLKRLAWLLDYYDEQTQDVKELAAPLLSIDLLQEHDLLENTYNKEVLEWLHESKFYNEIMYEVRQCTTEIRDLYNSKSSGNHEATRELLEWFEGLSDFIHQNGIMLNLGGFQEPLASTFIEGICASIKCNSHLSGRFVGLSNRFVEVVLLNIHPEIIYKYANRYKIKKIPAVEALTGFHKKWRLLFLQFPTIQAYHLANDSNKMFSERYERILYTTMAVFSLVETTDAELNEFCSFVIQLFKEQKMFHEYKAVSAILFLIDKNKKNLSTETIKGFTELWLTSPGMRSPRLLNLIADIVDEREEKIDLTEDQFKQATDYFFSISETNKTNDGWDSICELFRVLSSEEQKKVITEYALNKLQSNFNAGDYYEAIMYGVIQPTDELNTLYLQFVEDIVSMKPREQFWWNDEFFHDRRVDQFFNYYFKFKISIPDHLRKLLKEFDPYYDWLLDMEDFDYKNFNPKWLQNYFSYYFKQEYRNSKRLKEFLQPYIKDNFDDADAQRVFMFTYGYED